MPTNTASASRAAALVAAGRTHPTLALTWLTPTIAASWAKLRSESAKRPASNRANCTMAGGAVAASMGMDDNVVIKSVFASVNVTDIPEAKAFTALTVDCSTDRIEAEMEAPPDESAVAADDGAIRAASDAATAAMKSFWAKAVALCGAGVLLKTPKILLEVSS